jgi:hypothetical protein
LLSVDEPVPPGATLPPPLRLARAGDREQVSPDLSEGSRHVLSGALPSNPEMRAIFEADQADRKAGGAAIDWEAVSARDRSRRARTRELLDAGALQSGDDFWHAAFVFQHGGESASYLFAHTLALAAAARGRPDATWIAAATLDRYLQSIGKPQVYGTQYSGRNDTSWTQEPYDQKLIPDSLRVALGVPTLAQQAEQGRQMEVERQAQGGSRK